MAFKPQKREDFLSSLKNIEINRPPEETLLENFNSDGLSNLYELFLKLKNVPLDKELFNKLSDRIYSHYSEDIASLLHNPITDNEINQLLEIIKQEYLEIINNNNPQKISKTEQDSLKSIVNKHFPALFLDFIENPINAENFTQQQKLIKDTVLKLSDAYYNQVNPHGQQNSDYLASAIYLIYKKTFPELSITEPSREKGLKSFDDNMHKELNKGLQNTIPSDIKTGITLPDMEKQIVSNTDNPNNFTDKTNSDFSGITIVLNHIDDAMYFEENDPENGEILELKKQRNKNLKFVHSLKKYLLAYDFCLTQEEYFQIYIELLHRLQDSTYPECTHEIKEGNYSLRLEIAIKNYQKLASTDAFAPNATKDEVQELDNLVACLIRRLDDKLENEVLRVTFPQVLEDSLLTDDFKIKGEFVKFAKKENGFCAIYYELTDALGRKTEVQLQSNMRYKETKNGPSTHNDMPNKKVDIKHFFELTDNRNDPELLNDYLFLLGRTSKKQEEELKMMLQKEQEKRSLSTNTPQEKRALDNSIKRLQKKIEAIETAKSNIKIKDEFIEDSDMIDIDNTMKEDNYDIKYIGDKPVKVYDTKTTKRTSEMTIEQYLPIYAEYMSPADMKIISSAHATAPEAYVNRKDLIESFTEILRKGDEIPYLSELLIDKLKDILKIKNTNQLSYEDLKKYALDSENGFYASNGTKAKEDDDELGR